MSDTSSLTQLARFIGQSALSSGNEAERRRAVNAIVARLQPPPRRSVGELLGAVLALSARTRRMRMPRIAIELDVFAPDGARAVRLLMPGA
ncbi:MAG TPA: hypothetical protein GYA10_04895 [Alphaproteobacteria bacterium]|nr:hypothetical protein [Alphaproteobacteria bacterium]